MLATIAAMMRRTSLSDDELALAAAGCRALAFRYREDAKRQKNPILGLIAANEPARRQQVEQLIA